MQARVRVLPADATGRRTTTPDEVRTMTAFTRLLRDTRRAVAFHYAHGGYSYHPARETQEQGRRRCARSAAMAEARFRLAGGWVEWSEDDDADRSGIDHDAPLYVATAYLPDADADDGNAIAGRASCGSIDLGAEPSSSDPYRRVMAADLAAELLPTRATV